MSRDGSYGKQKITKQYPQNALHAGEFSYFSEDRQLILIFLK